MFIKKKKLEEIRKQEYLRGLTLYANLIRQIGVFTQVYHEPLDLTANEPLTLAEHQIDSILKDKEF